MNVRAVVKVMNFHALLRVDSSRRKVELLATMEEELEAMMRIVLSNRNFRLDKRIAIPDPSLPVLRIYIGSDLGFCGGINATVNSEINSDKNSEKILIGKKLRKNGEIALFVTHDQIENDFNAVKKYLDIAVRERKWSAIELVYNHFYNISNIKRVERRIYPLEDRGASIHQWDDFVVEGDTTKLLEAMIISYLTYELKIALANAQASENTMRQNATQESLKKIDEMEAESNRMERKEKNRKTFQKTIDGYVKQKSIAQNVK